jgi:hypothetical protein
VWTGIMRDGKRGAMPLEPAFAVKNPDPGKPDN